MYRVSTATALLLVLLPACDDEPVAAIASVAEPASAPADGTQEPISPAAKYGFTDWRDDFPIEIQLSPPVSGRWYDHTAKQALERVIAKLSGGCSRPAWLMAKQFFEVASERAVPLLIKALDTALQSHAQSDMAENVVEALGRMGRFRSAEIGDALLRALHHQKVSVQNKAMASLSIAGTGETLRQAAALLENLQERAQADWVRGVRRLLPEAAASIYSDMLRDNRFIPISGVVVEEAVKLPPVDGATVLAPLWQDSQPQLRLTIASVLHGAGDLRGTAHIRQILRGDSPVSKGTAIQAATAGDMAPLLDDIMKLSMDPNPDVRTAVATAIVNVPGENVDNLLSTLALDETVSVRQVALLALRMRGQRDHLDRLIDQVRTATGTRLSAALADLTAAKDGRAIPVIYERYKTAPDLERRKYLQVIGLSGTEAAFDVLEEVFLGPEQRIDAKGRDTVSYSGVMLQNLRTSRHRILQLLGKVPRDDYRRRATILHCLANLAAFDEDEEFRTAVYDTYRTILQDRTEISQLRLLALDLLRRDIRVDDATTIKKMQEHEDQAMRRALTGFLFEFF